MTYNWQQPDWPQFTYDPTLFERELMYIIEKMGFLSGQLSHLSSDLKTDAYITLMVEEAVKTSQIEGEFLNRLDVRSSIQRKLGLKPDIANVRDKRAQGIADLLLTVQNTYQQPMTDEMLFDWHLMIMSGTLNANLRVGCWRSDDEPMQVVSGNHDKWTVHFEAPPSQQVPDEMKRFIQWFNEVNASSEHSVKNAPLYSAIAHLYFESIHPFEDGNGRIGRAIAEKALSQGFGYPVMLSLSQTIEADKNAYYAALHAASRSNEISAWISYFLKVIIHAQQHTEQQVHFILKKSAFFDKYQDALNERQMKIMQRMFRAGIQGFEGGMSAKKYMTITGTSKATATRDLQQLSSMQILKPIGSGRNVRYELDLELIPKPL